MNRHWFSAAACGLALSVLPAVSAQAATQVMNFDNACLYSGGACPVQASYGDTPQTNVSYRAYRAVGGETVHGHLQWWDVGYGDLQGVVFGGSNATGYVSEIKFTAAPGYQLSLLDFDLATYAGRSGSTPVSILDLAGNLLSTFTADTAWPKHGHVSANTDYLDGVILRWGPDGYEVGLDNIRYDVRAIGSAVPEPSIWAMMILGTGCVGAALRRRRTLRPLTA